MKNHSIPMRRCVGCMTSYPKKDLVRFAVSSEGPTIDTERKQDGRGIYLCRSIDCFEKAVKRKRISNDFKLEFEKVVNDVEVTV